MGVSALSDQLTAGAITMGERPGSDDAQVLDAEHERAKGDVGSVVLPARISLF